ncbi:MAG: penicillin acylase family protein [Ktedonobacterales bacterium]
MTTENQPPVTITIDRLEQPQRSPRWRRITLRVVIGVLVAVVVLVGLGAGVGYAEVQRTLPTTEGTLKLPGLQQPVSVVRDQWGVPHISGYGLNDLAYAQGYVTAQDRLFQMEMNRAIAQGRLAELFGPGSDNSLLDADEFLRTLNLYQSARIELLTIDPLVRGELQSYADGVNAFLSSHGGNSLTNSLPLEFKILGVTPEPWKPVDSLAYGRVVALSLDSNWRTKYARALTLAKLGPDATNALYPAYPAANPTLFTATGEAAPITGASPLAATTHTLPATATVSPAARAATDALSDSTLLRGADVVQQLLGGLTDALGSNDWVIDGTKTTTGAPLLANDPHLGINMPSIWYEIALRGGGLDVIGYSFPGDPGVVIGHNDRIAWGVTNVGADDTDLYLETLDPTSHPGQYLSDGQWLPLVTRQETIKVRGAKSVTITVRSTRHGPLLNDSVSDLNGTPPVALKWTALQSGYSFAGFFQIDFARNWQGFLQAVSNISISQNFVYADIDGHIGYRMSGLLPIRSPDNDLLPVDGSTSAHDWQGYVPQTQMPTLFDPPTHMIVTANNQIVPDNAPIYVAANWDHGYRARRITDLLTAKAQVSVADFENIQADVYNIPAATLVPQLVSAGNATGGDAATAANLLSGWDDTMTRDSVAAAVFEVTAGNLLRDTVEPALGKSLYDIYRSNYSPSGVFDVLLRLVDNPTAPFASSAQDMQTKMAQALAQSVSQLRTQFGADSAKWQWGQLHQAHFTHPLATVSPLNMIFGVAPVARPGDSVTVNVGGDGGFTADAPNYNQATVSSMREIIDLSNLDNSLWITTTGESGEPYSGHYTDLLALWDQNKYEQMNYTPSSLARTHVHVLVLKP